MDLAPPSPRAGWPIALETPTAIRVHLDFLVHRADRGRHAAHAVLCDAGSQPVVHRMVAVREPDPSVVRCAGLVGRFAVALVRRDPRGRLLLAVTRPGPSRVTDVDRRWFQGLNRACATHDVSPLGAWVLTSGATFPVTVGDVI